jgi:tetratricopeptide (TPR) repeat protein
LTGVLLPASSAQRTFQEHFLAAQQDQQQGKYDEAAYEYQAVLHLQPALPEAYINLGLVYFAQSKFDESARALTQAVKLRPHMRGVDLWLGIDAVKLHRPAQGVELLRAAIRQNPADRLAQSWLGTALWNAGQMDDSLLQLRHVTAQFPDDPDLLFALGEAYGKAAGRQTEQLIEESSGTALSDLIYGSTYAGEQEWVKAEGHLRRAIERDPNMVHARLKLAEVLLAQGHVQAAAEQLQQAAELTPRAASAWARSGELLLLMGKQEEGLASIGRALEIDSGEALNALQLPPEGLYDHSGAQVEIVSRSEEALKKLNADVDNTTACNAARAALYVLAGDQDSARQSYRKIHIAHIASKQRANSYALAMDALYQHRYDDAEVALLRWLAAHPHDLAARYKLILVRRQISMEQLARLLAVDPDSYHVHQMQAQLYVSHTMANEDSDGLQEDDKAMTEYLAVAAAKPNLPDVHFWLGHLYWKHGDADHALAELTRELELDPSHPEANGEMGAILVAEERASDAIPHLEMAIRNQPDLWPAYLQLGRAYAMNKDYLRAEQMLKHALAHDQDASIHYQLGLVLRAEGKTEQADQVFAQVRAIKKEKMSAFPIEAAAPQEVKQ